MYQTAVMASKEALQGQINAKSKSCWKAGWIASNGRLVDRFGRHDRGFEDIKRGEPMLDHAWLTP